MNAQFTPTLPGSNNGHSSGRRVDTYDRGYNRGTGCNEGTDLEALHLAHQGQLNEQGYHNDGFVVSDSQSEADDDSSSDYTPEELSHRLRSSGKDADDSSSDYTPSSEDDAESENNPSDSDEEVDDDGSDYVPSEDDDDDYEDDDDDDDC
jgi:hypothetical protein